MIIAKLDSDMKLSVTTVLVASHVAGGEVGAGQITGAAPFDGGVARDGFGVAGLAKGFAQEQVDTLVEFCEQGAFLFGREAAVFA